MDKFESSKHFLYWRGSFTEFFQQLYPNYLFFFEEHLCELFTC